jgi:hypothetical protein
VLISGNGAAFPEKYKYNTLAMKLETSNSSEILVSGIRTQNVHDNMFPKNT